MSTTLPFPVEPSMSPKEPWWKNRWFIGGLGLVLGLGLGSLDENAASESVVSSSVPTHVVTYEEVEATVTTTATETETVESTVTVEPPGPAAVFGDGMFAVGTDIRPGTYQSTSADCYWARLRNGSGQLEAIIANGTGASIVTISKKDSYFESRYCGEWVVKRS